MSEFPHTCPACVPLGSFEDPEEGHLDLYWHVKRPGRGADSLLARYGSEPEEYISWHPPAAFADPTNLFRHHAWYPEILKRGKEAGLYDGPLTLEEHEQAQVQAEAASMAHFNEALLALDYKLTGKKAEAASQLRTIRLDEYEWIDRELYLSDGGYSRVVFNYDTGRLFLTSNSLDTTKARWESALEERRAVERIARKAIQESGGSPETWTENPRKLKSKLLR